MLPRHIEVVKATAGVVGANAFKITSDFYPRMFKNNPEVWAFFNKSNQRKGRQPAALAEAIVGYAMNIEDLSPLTVPGGAVEMMTHKHCALNVMPEHYQIVYDNIMASIGEVLGDAVTPEIGEAWGAAVMNLAQLLIDEEVKLYDAAEAAPGGWRGKREFIVNEVVDESRNVKSLHLVPADGGGVASFRPGQYTTVCDNPSTEEHFAPRHYSLTSKPHNPDHYRVTLKTDRTSGKPAGVMSSFLMSRVKGDKVHLYPTFGPHRLDFSGPSDKHMAFVSTGVGCTPQMSMLEAAYKTRKSVSVFHADTNKADQPFRDEIKEMAGAAKCDTHTSYSYEKPDDETRALEHYTEGNLDADKILNTLSSNGIPLDKTEVFLCVQPNFLKEVVPALNRGGIARGNIKYETMGPHIHIPREEGCP